MASDAASSSSQLRSAVPPKRVREEEEFETNETMKDLNKMKDELEWMRKTLLGTEEGRDMWRRLFEDCNKKQAEKIEPLKQEYNE